jgi:hypothetical protein
LINRARTTPTITSLRIGLCPSRAGDFRNAVQRCYRRPLGEIGVRALGAAHHWANQEGAECPLLTQSGHSQPHKNLRPCPASASPTRYCRPRSSHLKRKRRHDGRRPRRLPNKTFKEQAAILRNLLTAQIGSPREEYLGLKAKLHPCFQKVIETHQADLRRNLL